MAQIPEHHRPGLVSGGGDGIHIGEGSRPVVDVGEGHQRDLLVQQGRQPRRVGPADGIGLDESQLQAALRGQGLEDVEVGGEVAAVAQDNRTAGGGVEGGGRQFVEVDGRRVRENHFTRAGADKLRGQDVADLAGEFHPAIPAGNQLGAPLVLDQTADAVCRLPRQAAEGVPVHVDEVRVADHEAIPELSQGVGGVEGLRVRSIGRPGHGRPLSTGRFSHPIRPHGAGPPAREGSLVLGGRWRRAGARTSSG